MTYFIATYVTYIVEKQANIPLIFEKEFVLN